MDREELKCKLIEQFKAENSPIHALMYQFNTDRYKYRPQYEYKVDFCDAAYQLSGSIDTQYTIHGKPWFQINFNAHETKTCTNVATVKLMANQVFPGFFREIIYFDGTYVCFAIEKFRLTSVDYNYKLDDQGIIQIVKFDIGTMMFENPDNDKNTVDGWDIMRRQYTGFFIEYRPEFNIEQKMDTFLRDNNIVNTKVKGIIQPLLLYPSIINRKESWMTMLYALVGEMAHRYRDIQISNNNI